MIIVFDGVCNLCNGFVQFVIKRDKKRLFKFASLQSVYGQGLMQHFKLNPQVFDTVLLYDGQKVLTRSDVALAVLTRLGGIWKLFFVCKALPRPVRDGFYNIIAKRRYKLFGKRETCMVPTPELKDRFVDEKEFSA